MFMPQDISRTRFARAPYTHCCRFPHLNFRINATKVAFEDGKDKCWTYWCRWTGPTFTLGGHVCLQTLFVTRWPSLMTFRSYMLWFNFIWVIQSNCFRNVALGSDRSWHIMELAVAYRWFRSILRCSLLRLSFPISDWGWLKDISVLFITRVQE